MFQIFLENYNYVNVIFNSVILCDFNIEKMYFLQLNMLKRSACGEIYQITGTY